MRKRILQISAVTILLLCSLTIFAAAATVTTPKASLAAGTYTGTQKVTLSASSGSAIYYTTDGSAPTKKSAKYTKEISISKNTTLKARAYKSGMAESAVMTAKYNIRTAKPKTSVKAGTYSGTQKVKLTAASGATIYYTTDGSTPTKTQSNIQKRFLSAKAGRSGRLRSSPA